jgi:sRNA-binding carbon storage regulator CsrA
MVVVDIRRDKVRLGFEAEDKVELHRREIAAKLGWTAKDPKQFNGEATPAAAGKEEGPAKLPA